MNSLPVISLVTTLVLGGAAIFLAMQNRVDAVRRQNQIDALQAQFSSAGAQVIARESSIEQQLMAESRVKDLEIDALKATLEAQQAESATLDAQIEKIQEEEAAALTPMQSKITSFPAIARVTDYVADLGFVAIDAGTNRQIAPGQTYHIRRDKYLIGLTSQR